MEQDEFQNKEEQHNSDRRNKSSQNTNRIMGIAAIFISVLSMFAVIYQSYLAREENELTRIQQSATVLPFLDYEYSNVGQEYKFRIKNKGIGPAFIKDVKFIGLDLKRKDSLFFNSSHELWDFVEQKSTFLDTLSIIKSSFEANMLLSPNESRDFFIIRYEDYNQRNKISRELSKYYAGVKIIYEDVYGTGWILDSDKV